MNPRRNARLTARPVWSGPRLNRKVARTLSRSNRLTRRGTPSRVPRSVSTSIFRAIRDISGKQLRLLTQLGSQRLQVQPAGSRCHRQKLQHTAVPTFDMTLTADSNQSGARLRDCSARHNPRLMNPPALTLDSGERSRKWRRHRAYQVVNLLRRPAPVDPAIFGTAASKILPGLDWLDPPRRRARNQSWKRPRQNGLGSDGDLRKHLAGIIIPEYGDGKLIHDFASISALNHVMQGRARFALTSKDRPVHGRPAAVLRQH